MKNKNNQNVNTEDLEKNDFKSLNSDTEKTGARNPRPPVVVVLGHVDHGKSSLLEGIKDLKITSKESGGITQHIGAYEVEHNSKKITFIDTPGHEAFFAIRARGAKVADIAVLVVAAEEGVKKQTEEAISHIKGAGIPIIVAINKIDKPNANPEKVKSELAKRDILVEEMGGKIPCVNVSAMTKQGIPDLLEIILLLGEISELKGDISKKAEGVVIESHMDSRRGPVASVIIMDGVLRKGDILFSPSSSGKAKIIENFQGKQVLEALPSAPALILGFEKVPHVGDEIKVISSEEETGTGSVSDREKIFSAFFGNNLGKKTLNLIIRADVLGSLEALEHIFKTIPQDKVGIKIIKAEVGGIDESDIKLAQSTGARIIGFRVKTGPIARDLAAREQIRIINFDIVYELAESIKNLMEKLIEPEIQRKEIGKVKILEFFKKDKNSQIIGGRVIDGEIKKGAFADVVRNEEKIGQGKIINLQCNKKNVGDVLKGQECGIVFSDEPLIERGDILEVYIEERIKGEL